MKHSTLILVSALAFYAMSGWALAADAASDGIVLEEKNIMLVRDLNRESLAIRGTTYSDYTYDEEELSASFVVDGPLLGIGSRRVMGKGIRRISWEPAEGGTLVNLQFAHQPVHYVMNAMGGTQARPNIPQVLASFSFDPQDYSKRTMFGKRHQRSDEEIARDQQYGGYELPGFPDGKYSDARVTLKVVNGDFRDILWYMSEIGNISIVLDPYWGDEPTGSRRPPGGGVDPGNPGIEPGDDFIPGLIRNGVGQLTLNFEDVPFGEALDLILMAVGLVKVDLY